MRSLLEGVVDYAGLFPPAALSLEATVRNYSAYRSGPNVWMLGRLIVPAARLSELHKQFETASTNPAWRISVLVGEDYQSDFNQIRAFNKENGQRALVDVMEASPKLQNDVQDVLAATPAGNTIYFEVALDTPVDQLASIHRSGARAKIRTGGLLPQAIPQAPDLARFLVHCAAAGVAFKATAGLHHPIRCLKPLTYDANAPQGQMHGFVNLLFASALAMDGASMNVLGDVLGDNDGSSFGFTDSEATWKQMSISIETLRDTRERLMISFGSCSFDEPLQELEALEWL